MRRHEITDDSWNRIKNLLPGKQGDPGVTAKDNRQFVNAVLWIAKTGAPWRDLPERFGNWNSVWRRFDRWARKRVWERVFRELQDPDLEWLLLDSTVIRPTSMRRRKKGLPTKYPNSRHWAAPEAASPPRSTYPSVVWACRWKSD